MSPNCVFIYTCLNPESQNKQKTNKPITDIYSSERAPGGDTRKILAFGGSCQPIHRVCAPVDVTAQIQGNPVPGHHLRLWGTNHVGPWAQDMGVPLVFNMYHVEGRPGPGYTVQVTTAPQPPMRDYPSNMCTATRHVTQAHVLSTPTLNDHTSARKGSRVSGWEAEEVSIIGHPEEPPVRPL